MQIQEHLGNSEISIYMFREICDVLCSSDGLQALNVNQEAVFAGLSRWMNYTNQLQSQEICPEARNNPAR